MIKNSTDLVMVGKVDPTKAEAQLLANDFMEAVENGEIDVLALAVRVDWLITMAEHLKGKMKEKVLSAVEKYGKTSCVVQKATFKIKEVGTKWDYTSDAQWNKLNDEMLVLKEKMKEREAFLKTVTKKMEIVDEETGDIEKIVPPIKQSTTGYALTLGAE